MDTILTVGGLLGFVAVIGVIWLWPRCGRRMGWRYVYFGPCGRELASLRDLDGQRWFLLDGQLAHAIRQASGFEDDLLVCVIQITDGEFQSMLVAHHVTIVSLIQPTQIAAWDSLCSTIEVAYDLPRHSLNLLAYLTD